MMAAGIIAVAGPQFSVTESSCHKPHPLCREAHCRNWRLGLSCVPFSFASTLNFVFFVSTCFSMTLQKNTLR